MKNINTFLFSDKTYSQAALVLGTTILKLQKLNIALVNPQDLNPIQEAYVYKPTEEQMESYDHSNDFRGECSIKTYKGKILCYSTFKSDIITLCICYLYKYKMAYYIPTMLCGLYKLNLTTSKIVRLEEEILDVAQRISICIHDLSFRSFKPLNVSSLNRIAKKFNAKITLDNDMLVFTFFNVKSGNESEGYIKYKYISLYCNIPYPVTRETGFNFKRVIYGFRGFTYDSASPIRGVGYLHPHVSTRGTICFGDRLNDWINYVSTYNYGFMLELVNDSLNNYYPESPYSTVSQIKNKVKVLTKIYKDAVKMNPGSCPEEISEHVFGLIIRCNRCNMIMGSTCVNSECEANPNAEINCDECGSLMERGEWSEFNERYNWICRNSDCSHGHPISNQLELEEVNEIHNPHTNITTVNPLTCRICGHSLNSGNAISGQRFSEENFIFNNENRITYSNDIEYFPMSCNCLPRFAGLPQYLVQIAGDDGSGNITIDLLSIYRPEFALEISQDDLLSLWNDARNEWLTQ